MTLPVPTGAPLQLCAEASAPQPGLGALCYGLRPATLPAQPRLFVAAPRLEAGAPGWQHGWQGHGTVRQGHCHGIHYATDGDTLFGCLTLPETRPEEGETPLQSAAARAYRALFACLDELGFPHLWRVWNYLADINRVSHGLERYRQFNIGRLQAFRDAGREAVASIPAACALGTAAGPLSMAFIAGRTPAIPVENPRQVSAYRYPADYGPVSPTFARAAVVPGESPLFLLSGTASIVGHETRHAGDVLAQTRETIANILAVLDEAATRSGQAMPAASDLAYTVYLRHPADLAAVRTLVQEHLQPRHPPLYLQADICRADLQVEIEASNAPSLEIPS